MRSKEATKLLGVTKQTLLYYIEIGKLRAIKKDDGRYDYNDDDVYALSGITPDKIIYKLMAGINIDIENDTAESLVKAKMKSEILEKIVKNKELIKTKNNEEDEDDVSSIIKDLK